MQSWIAIMKTEKPKSKRRAQPSLLLKQMKMETRQSKENKIERMIEAKVDQALRRLNDEPPT
jgi:hypothetical protein